ncbi:hypothetical protein B9Z55_026027 [Caenorhabditis nigoni]|uniref:Uncharacterized protein n=1 Tax=Caenorhabditis nigoni TaxID=1611254 RepID=A0A2G5T1S0_9PELO|nr:hypothetical protein B9Z55_026027 [Caenorhabditis nigoni]
MDQKDGKLSKEEKMDIAMALFLYDRRVTKYINDVKVARLSDFSQRLTIENLKPANSSLPAAPYMAMELFTRTKMNGRTRMEKEKMKLRRSVNEQYQEYASIPDEKREEMDAKIRFQQEEIRLDNVEDREIERERDGWTKSNHRSSEIPEDPVNAKFSS